MAPFYPPLPEARPANLVGSALAGYGAVQDVQNAQTRNALGQIQLGKAQRGESALADFTKSGDMESYMRADPKAALEMQEAFSKMDERQQKLLTDKVKVFDDHKAYAINNPEVYKAMLDGLGPEFSKFFPAPDKFAAMSPAQRQDELFKKEKIVGAIKQAMPEYQRLKLTNVDIPKAQMDIAHKGAQIDQGTARNALLKQHYETDAQYKNRMAKVAEGRGPKEAYDEETVTTPTNPVLGMPGGGTTVKRKIPRAAAAPPGGTTKQYTSDQLQAAYAQKAAQIEAMPDGIGKQNAMQQLLDWKSKHLGE